MITFKQSIVGILGNIATTFSFLPYLPNFIHKFRGVRFENFLKVHFSSNVILDNRYPDKIRIDKGVVFATGSLITAHSFVPKNNKVVGIKEIIKSVFIGKNVFIGAKAIILPGTHLEEGCYVAAGAVVSGKFKKNCLIAGNPAIIKRSIKS
ncbi:possible acetyltransferase [Prochlorococcus marinus subsp. pastoris str. CCMP1986]|uniref:Possible acetyltransferase n=1 Tax=Prochlorococcus marinus subsp. pastoris (strain CCMP1986 / NIES-2087 / MED4) TaxID=59919 RepID=Q7V0K4_PROMP|nr:DapH/DapD/GlmU-related protein [Prochlorococcus marinus]KGF87186.1 EpsM [Prochlorococcus marinus str. EQPAC1]CAE19711.1 possible acetyltransferase [Prochlorococcus marinus subsp. pastoris str. CCMP1986]